MDYQSMYQLKGAIEDTKSLMNTIEGAVDVSSVFNTKLEIALEASLMMYSFRIISADGIVSKDEAVFISEMFKDMLASTGHTETLTAESTTEMIKTVGLEEGVPPVFMVMKLVDEALVNAGASAVSPALINLFNEVGNFIIGIENSPNPRATTAHSQGMNAIRMYCI